ncbi:hypothetical protein RBG61_13005 [Paludicola sp. MB14-C6]|nr:hypothetical protein [Paludicola sp. MB14-C6]WMJ22893.1 hypothetical protein RBG61_13005 [Paludicola sp. MB14-C6]
MKTSKRVIAVDDFEYRVMVKAVNEFRTDLKKDEKPTEEVDIC